MNPLDDNELDHLLAQWRAPGVPYDLKRRALPRRAPWWQWLVTGRVSIPAPVVVVTLAVLIALALGAIREAAPPATPQVLDVADFQPVTNLNPRIVRSQHEVD